MTNPEILIIGAGPAGYVCAIRLGQLGKKILLVDKDKIGGVCLNRGCITTKALLHCTQIISETKNLSKAGINYTRPNIDLQRFNQYIQNIPIRLRRGIEFLLRENNVEYLQAEVKFLNNSDISLKTADGKTSIIKPNTIIIANGSDNSILPNININNVNIITSDQALQINEIPKNFVIIGAGAIGLEFATIYTRLGSKVKVIEIMPQILPGTDAEFASLLMNIMRKQDIEFFLNSKVSKITENNILNINVLFNEKELSIDTDKILVAVGRKPNTDNLGLTNTDIKLTEKKFIDVNSNFETSRKNIFAIGDVIGQPLLAHKAMAQGVYLAEFLAGIDNITPPNIIPNCIYTDPEFASVGLSENEAIALKYDILIGKAPLTAIGRAHTLNRIEGMVKVIVDKKTEQLIGAQILAPDASNLINEFTLAINSEIKIDKIIDTVHPHPTLSEALLEAVASVRKKAIHIINK